MGGKCQNESADPQVSVQIGNVERWKLRCSLKHEMAMKFDEVCVYEKVLEITLFSDPTWTFERKCQLASFVQNRCQVSRTQKIQSSKVKTKI